MRILVIEDDKDLADVVRKAMKEESYAVDIAHDGLTGEDFALSEEYDLIILDIMLPRKDGISVLKTLRNEGLSTAVLLLTARNEIRDRVAGLDCGADDYLTKPFALEELRARARALFRRNSQEKSTLLSAGNLTLNTASHQVTLEEKLIDLTQREYAILEYLIRNKNRLISKAMIAEHVWDYHFSSDYNLIEVYIRRLRKKLDGGCRQNVMHTVRNSGYIIRESEF